MHQSHHVSLGRGGALRWDLILKDRHLILFGMVQDTPRFPYKHGRFDKGVRQNSLIFGEAPGSQVKHPFWFVRVLRC